MKRSWIPSHLCLSKYLHVLPTPYKYIIPQHPSKEKSLSSIFGHMNHPRSLIEVQILIWWMWGGAWDSQCLTSCWCYGSVEGRLARLLPCPCGQGRGCQPERVAHCVRFTLHWGGHEVQAWPDKVPTWNIVLLSPAHMPQISLASGGGSEVHSLRDAEKERREEGRENRRGQITPLSPEDPVTQPVNSLLAEANLSHFCSLQLEGFCIIQEWFRVDIKGNLYCGSSVVAPLNWRPLGRTGFSRGCCSFMGERVRGLSEERRCVVARRWPKSWPGHEVTPLMCWRRRGGHDPQAGCSVSTWACDGVLIHHDCIFHLGH